MLRRLRTIADHRLTPFILVLYFTLDFACIWQRFRHGVAASLSAIAVYRFLDSINIDPGTALHEWSYSISFVRENDGSPVKQDGIDRQTPGYYARCSILTADFGRGLYAPTTQFQQSRLRVLEKLPSDDPAVVDVVAQTADDYIKKFGSRWRHPDQLRAALTSPTRSYVETTHLPLGYLHNTLSLLMFALLCWSLRLNILKLWRHRIDPTKCPHCRYSTIGLTNNVCPECGQLIT